MIPTPQTLADAAEIREALTALPASANERMLRQAAIESLTQTMPVSREVVGEALIQSVKLANILIDKIRELDSFLDWETTVAIALNVMLAAGAELLADVESAS